MNGVKSAARAEARHRVVLVAGVDRRRAAPAARRATGTGPRRTAPSTRRSRGRRPGAASARREGQRVDALRGLVERHATAARCPPSVGSRPGDQRRRTPSASRSSAPTAISNCSRSPGIAPRRVVLDRSRGRGRAAARRPPRRRAPARDRRSRSRPASASSSRSAARRGARPAWAANGVGRRRGPGRRRRRVGPAITSSATAVSCVVRETTPSTPRNDSPTQRRRA